MTSAPPTSSARWRWRSPTARARPCSAGAALAGSDAAALVTLRNYAEGEPLELLRRALALSQPGVVRLADRLQARGLVERHRSERDGRAVGLRLTPAGRQRRRRRPRRARRRHRRGPRHPRRRPAARPGSDARAHARRRDDRRDRQPRDLPDVRPRRVRPPRPLPGDAGGARDRLSVTLAHRPLGSRSLHLPAPGDAPLPAREVRAAARAADADGIARPDEIHECEPVPWEWIEAVQEPALVERIRAGALSVREQRGARAAVVAGARRARPAHDRRHRRRGAPRARARHRHEPRRRHPPRRLRLRARLLPVQRRRRGARPVRPTTAPGARWWSTATSTRATAPRRSSRPDPAAFTLSLHGARNYPFQRIAPTSTSTSPTGPATRLPARARWRARRGAAARPSRRRLLPRRRRPVRGRPAGPPGADQARPARARRTGPRAPARGGRGRRRGARRGLRARRRATPSTSTRRPRPWWPPRTSSMVDSAATAVPGCALALEHSKSITEGG